MNLERKGSSQQKFSSEIDKPKQTLQDIMRAKGVDFDSIHERRKVPGVIRPWVKNPSTSEVVILSEEEGKERFNNAVTATEGRALVVVHPFYHENTKGRDNEKYKDYKKRLEEEVGESTVSGIPLVLFESAEAVPRLPDTLARIGKMDGEVFVVETRAHSPEPKNDTLEDFSKSLHEQGLTQVVITGSYLDVHKSPLGEGEEKFDGCVGQTINTFNKNDISVIVGNGVYPGYQRKNALPSPKEKPGE